MTDLVHLINHTFYSKLNNKQLHFLLFLDTEKAFDSIHHPFILASLQHIGMPVWLVNCVAALLTGAAVSPVLANDKTHFIPIHRGVKQGCPLSPLLFIICFEFLLQALADECPDAEANAAADDLVISAGSLPPLFRAMIIINQFSYISGLGINMGKSAVVPTRADPDLLDSLRQLFKLSPWPKIELRLTYTHLGVLLGHGVFTENIFIEAHNKALGRIRSYSRFLSSVSIPKRIIIVNTFITPVYMYLGSFFIIPYSLTHDFNVAVQRAIIPHAGTTFKRIHLIKAHPLHFKPPLRDLWAANIATIAARFPFGSYDPNQDPNPNPSINENSCCIAEHIDFAAKEFLLYRAKACPNGAPNPLSDDTKSQQSIYARLASYGWHSLAEKDWVRKLKLFKLPIGDPSSALNNLTSSFTSLTSPKIPPHVRGFFLSFLFNALTTSGRRAKFSREPPKPCPFCHSGPDHFYHFLHDCPPVWEAIATNPRWLALGLPPHSTQFASLAPLFTLTSQNIPSHNPKQAANFIVALPAALWNARQRAFAKGDSSGLSSFLEDQIDHFFDGLTFTARKRARATDKAKTKIAAIPSHATIAYTDGSADPNPGPAGAGAFISSPSITDTCIFQPLGPGTNNIGEMWAVGIALSFISQAKISGQIFICSDSEFTIGILSLGHSPSDKFAGLAQAVSNLISNLEALGASFHFIWTPGHSNIYGNEIADRLAAKGSKQSRSIASPIQTPHNLFPFKTAPRLLFIPNQTH